MRKRFGTFSGGIDLPDDKEATLDSAIVFFWPLSALRVPLAALAATPATPTVSIGQRVHAGQCLARGGPGQLDVFAPLAGEVTNFEQVLVPDDPEGWRASPAVRLERLQEPSPQAACDLQYEWQEADASSLRARLEEGALPVFRPGFSSVAAFVQAAVRAKADVLIANVVENSPLVTADHRLLAQHGGDVLRGLAILARAVGARETMLAVDGRRTQAYRQTVRPARHYGIAAVAVAPKYPIGADELLAKLLSRREAPVGGSTLDVGVAVIDAATCRAVYRWTAHGERAAGRVVTIAGPLAAATGNYFIPFGADALEVLALQPGRKPVLAVHGSAMTGRQLQLGSVVTAQTAALLALEDCYAGPPSPCIRCGWCTDNCPARLNVAALNDDFELGRLDRAGRHKARACLGCGICSYVCPARLPLTQRAMALKRAAREGQPGRIALATK
jgi:electron transport complex protein RnfC